MAEGKIMHKHIIAALPLALFATISVAHAQQGQIPHELDAQLQCATAFALIAYRQAAGDPQALAYPALDARGREYFVQASAQAMDKAGLTRAQLEQAISRHAAALALPDALHGAMPACLLSLERSGL